jgi:hypothetical protein
MTNARVFPWFRGFLSGVILSTFAVPTVVTLAQIAPVSYSDLFEAQGSIRNCRMVIEVTQSEVFDNTDLSRKPENRLATLPGGQYVLLTGVFRKFDNTTAVQIFTYGSDEQYFEAFGDGVQPVGWVDASKLTTCDYGG